MSSLYTNNPVKDIKKEAVNKLYSCNVERPSVGKDAFLTLIE